MVSKKYQVFISSTYIDLIEERKKILEILLMADCIPAGMESFVATDDTQFEVIKKVIDLCDYYVLIIGKRYGSIHAETGVSYTEMEYDYAKSKNIPVLVFALDTSVENISNIEEEDIEKQYKLKLFREKAMENRLASIWRNSIDLTGQLAISIMRAKQDIFRPGWQRATDFDEASLRREIMELKTKNEQLQNNLDLASAKLYERSNRSEIAFEDEEVLIKYSYYDSGHTKRSSSNKILLTELFKTISIEMMDVSITETVISDAIKRNHLVSGCYFADNQIVKKILNQFKALGLIYSKWSNEKSALFWGISELGISKRDEMILIKKLSINETEI